MGSVGAVFNRAYGISACREGFLYLPDRMN